MHASTAPQPQPAAPAASPATAPLALLALLNFAVGLGAFVVIGVLSPVAAHFGVSRADAGWLMTVYAIVYAVSSPLLVATTGHWSRGRVLAVGIGLFIAGAVLASAATAFGVLVAARVLMALGGGLLTPVAAAVAVIGVEPSARGRALARVFGGLTLAQAAGVPVGAWLGYTFGWRSAFEAVAVVSTIAAVALWRTMPRDLHAAPTSLASLRQVLASGRLMGAVGFTALFVGGLYVVYTYLAPLFETRWSLAGSGVSAMLLVFGLGAVVGNALGGWMTDRIGAVRTLLVLCAAQAVAMPLLTLAPMPVLAAAAVVAAWSVFAWSFMVAQQARLVALAPPLVPVLFALNAAAIYVGASVGSLAGGQVLSAAGVGALGPAGALLAVAAAASILLVARVGRARG